MITAHVPGQPPLGTELLRVHVVGAPPPSGYQLVVRNPSNGDQRFRGASLQDLARRISSFGGFSAQMVAGVLEVSGADLVSASPGLAVEVVPVPDPAKERLQGAAIKEANRRAMAAAHAAVDFGTLLRDYHRPPPVVRTATLEWLRRTPVEDWAPLRVTLNERGVAILTDGHHRVTVARELGVGQLRAYVRLWDGYVERRVGIGGTADATSAPKPGSSVLTGDRRLR